MSQSRNDENINLRNYGSEFCPLLLCTVALTREIEGWLNGLASWIPRAI